MLRILGSLSLLLFSAMLASDSLRAASLTNIRQSVYKIRVESQDPDFRRPWAYNRVVKSKGTGFYIGDRRILTNAHVISNTRYISIQRDGDAEAVPAYATFVAHDSDLAIITTNVKDYFKHAKPMKFGRVPLLRSPVSTIGFPTGGEQLSVTKGIVSRLGYRNYVHAGHSKHLLIQVDSAINPGNSGGPVVQRNRVIGVAFQGYTTAENTGYVIPVPVIKRFIKDIEDGRYDGHPEDGLSIQRWGMSNKAARRFHGLTEVQGGVKIAAIAPWSCAYEKLKKNDIILEVEGRPVGVDGKIVFQEERVLFKTLFDLKQMGEVITFKVSRDRKIIDVSFEVTPSKPHYNVNKIYPRHPRFVVYAGLVFTVLSNNLLRSWGEKWYRKVSPILKYSHFKSRVDPDIAKKQDQIVLVGRLPLSVNTYVTKQSFAIVSKVNGQEILSFQQFVDNLDQSKEEMTVIEFEGLIDPVVVETKLAQESEKLVKDYYGLTMTRWLKPESDDGAVKEIPEVIYEKK